MRSYEPKSTDILIIGAGVVGLTIARALALKGLNDIVVLEKESQAGLHASGRNSGVLHAGIYNHADSLKAKYCRQGASLMKDYCDVNGIPVARCGKVIVAKHAGELDTLHQLFKSAQANGAHVTMIDEKDLESIEPEASTFEKAIISHDTAVIDPKVIMQTLYQELKRMGVRIISQCQFIRCEKHRRVVTSKGVITYRYCINAAGAHADVVAHAFDVGHEYTLLPFKGVYQQCRPGSRVSRIAGNIYPVPDLRNPFLGVHFTKSASGAVYVGPTAIPCFGRENYSGLKGIRFESLSIMTGSMRLFLSNPKFRAVAMTEPKKYIPYFLYRDAKQLVQHLAFKDVVQSTKVGIRAQLVHWPTNELVMDFLIKKGVDSLHILNAISPAWTCSMAIAEHITNELSTMTA